MRSGQHSLKKISMHGDMMMAKSMEEVHERESGGGFLMGEREERMQRHASPRDKNFPSQEKRERGEEKRDLFLSLTHA